MLEVSLNRLRPFDGRVGRQAWDTGGFPRQVLPHHVEVVTVVELVHLRFLFGCPSHKATTRLGLEARGKARCNQGLSIFVTTIMILVHHVPQGDLFPFREVFLHCLDVFQGNDGHVHAVCIGVVVEG